MDFKKINKTMARKIFDNGGTVYLVPCKVYPSYDNMWVQPFELSKQNHGVESEDICPTAFDSIVNSFEYYNCQHNELGTYTSFYHCYDFESLGLQWAEKYGIVEYSIKGFELTYKDSYPTERTTYKAVVNLMTNKETRTPMTRYYKHFLVNL